MSKEIWKYVKGYDNRYMVSSLGRIKSMPRLKVKNERILKGGLDTKGYHRVNLVNSIGKVKFEAVHRLVAIHFIDNKNNKEFVNHIDKDKLNNTVYNLEWCTSRENNTHMRLSMKRSSKYTGVYYDKKRRKFYSTIKVNGNQVFLGRFASENEASKAYMSALRKYNIVNKHARHCSI